MQSIQVKIQIGEPGRLFLTAYLKKQRSKVSTEGRNVLSCK